MVSNCIAVFGINAFLWVGVELVLIGAARLHLFLPGNEEAFAEYRYSRAFDALLACCVLMENGAAFDPGGPWYERRIGDWVEQRTRVLAD